MLNKIFVAPSIILPSRGCAARIPVLAQHALGGAVLGLVVAFVVTSCLLEIALNRFFAVYFGVLFGIVGLVILIRVCAAGFPLPLRGALLCLSAIVLCAAVACVVVDHNALGLSSSSRIPLFAVLGSATTFALTFSLVDVLNATLKEPPVQSSMQVVTVLASSVMCGFMYGLVFGLLDVEDATGVAARVALMHDEMVSMPLGALVGALTAGANFQTGLAPRPKAPPRNDDSDFGF